MSTTGQQSLVEKLKGAGKADTFPAMLEQWKGEVARALPRHLNADRICRIALTAFRRNPKLGECDPKSVYAAVITASQLGLEIDTLGQAYLVPYEKRKQIDGQWRTVGVECQFVPGWKGLVDLMNRSGRATVYTGVIFKDQKYRFQDGSERRLDVLNETSLDDPADITHAYAIGRLRGNSIPIIELWRTEKLLRHRDRYNKVGGKHYSFGNWEMYCRKVVLLNVLKYLPLSAELTTSIELSHAAESPEGQGLTIEGTLDGSWAPPSAEDGNGSPAPAKQPNPAPTDGPAWPNLGADGLWRDSTGATFREDQHGWNSEEKRPSVTEKGVFRARRGVGGTATPAAHERAATAQQQRDSGGPRDEEGW